MPGFGDVISCATNAPDLTFSKAAELRFSNSAARPASMAECNSVPASGYDPQVRHVCFSPKGSLPPGAPAGQFTAGMIVQIN